MGVCVAVDLALPMPRTARSAHAYHSSLAFSADDAAPSFGARISAPSDVRYGGIRTTASPTASSGHSAPLQYLERCHGAFILYIVIAVQVHLSGLNALL
jgi:hypothetical protein